MRKYLLTFLSVIALMTCFGQSKAESIIVNDGTNLASNAPFYSLFCDYGTRTQFIIPASSLSQINGVSITGLTFFSTNTSGKTWDETFVVELTEVDETTFTNPSTFYLTNLTTVYTGGFALNTTGELNINFSSNYTYQGGNLLVSVGTPGMQNGVGGSVSFYGVSTSNVGTYGYNNSGSAGQYNNLPTTTNGMVSVAPKTKIYYMPAPTCTTEDFSELEGAGQSSNGPVPAGWHAYAPGYTAQWGFIPHATGFSSGNNTSLGDDNYIIMKGGHQNDTYCSTSYLVLPKYENMTGASFVYCYEDPQYGTLTLGYVIDSTEAACANFVTLTDLPSVTSATQYTLTDTQINTIASANGYIAIKYFCDPESSWYSAGLDDFEICTESQSSEPEDPQDPDPDAEECTTENFSNYSASSATSSGVLPTGWVGFTPSGSSSAYAPHVSNSSFASINGNYLIFVASSSTPTSIAILPQFEDDIISVEFDYCYESTSYGTLSVGYVTANTLAGCNSYVQLASFSSTTSVTHFALTQAQINQINENEGYIAFKFTNSGSLWYTAGIDNLEICVQTCPPSYSTQTYTACDSFTWIDGVTYTESNSTAKYVIDGGSVTGCDSIVKLNLTINYGEEHEYSVLTCEPYEWHDTTYETSGIYEYNGTNAVGCPIHETLELDIEESIPVDVYASACESYTWTDGNGQTYTQSGDYPYTYSTAACDTTKTLHLTVYHTETLEPEVVTACEQYEWFGVTYTVDGIYTHYTQLGAGCVRTETLILSIIHNETAIPEVVEICDSYEWYGETYTESGLYTHDVQLEAGCIRTETIDLTIFTTGDVDLEPVLACDSYEWYGETYTESASLTHESVLPGGCVRTEHLDLTIVEAVHADIEVTSCDSYVWNNQVYDEDGAYTASFASTVGCDSVVTMHLTLLHSVTNDIEAEACDRYTWNTVNYGNSGNYTQIFANAAGCDSIVTLHLTVKESTSFEFDAEECPGFVWNDNTYDTDGDYTQFFTGANGCDSAVTMHLTIKETPNYRIEVDTCEMYIWNGVEYTETGLYYNTFEAANGCDSTVTLVLRVHALPSLSISGEFWVAEGVRDSTTLWAWGGSSYLWSTGDTTHYIVVSPEHDSTYYVTAYNIWGCSVTEAVTVVNATGVAENAINLDVYPNPVRQTLHIAATEVKSMRLSDMLGQILFEQQTTDDNTQIDMSGFAPGTYLLHVTTSQGAAVRKIVKR